MAEHFELFRLSLLKHTTQQLNLLDKNSGTTREEHITKIFSEKHHFDHYGSEFCYSPDPTNSSQEFIVGRIGRNIETKENLPPEENLIESTRAAWRACLVVVDPKEHADGQKLAVQLVSQVGKPSSLIAAFISSINEKYSSALFSIEIKPIFDASSFWNFAENNKGNITSLTFEFIAPNMFGGRDNLTEDLREFREKEKAKKVKVNLCNDEGLDTNTERIKQSVDYVEKGCGSIQAKAKNRKTYNSTKKKKSVIIKIDDKNKKEPLSISKIILERLKEIFHRE